MRRLNLSYCALKLHNLLKMFKTSFISQLSRNELDEQVKEDYLTGFREKESKYNAKRIWVADLSPDDSLWSENVFESKPQQE